MSTVKRSRRRLIFLRLIEIVTLIVTAGVVIYLVVMAVKVNSGYAITQPTPEYQVKLQIIDGTGERILLAEIKKEIVSLTDQQMEISIVQTDHLKTGPIEKSMLIARFDNYNEAQMLAKRFGLDEDRISSNELEHNLNNVSVSLVLGTDARTVFINKEDKKEN